MKLTKGHKALRKWADKQPQGWRLALAAQLKCDPNHISHLAPRSAEVKRIDSPNMRERLILERVTGIAVEMWE